MDTPFNQMPMFLMGVVRVAKLPALRPDSNSFFTLDKKHVSLQNKHSDLRLHHSGMSSEYRQNL